MPTTIVTLPATLREKSDQKARLNVEGETIRAIIENLEQVSPGMRFRLCFETGELRPYVNIFIEHVNIRYLQGLDTPVTVGAHIHVFPSVAGG